MTLPHPPHERRRLAVLHATGLLDTAPEREFDDIAALAAQLCGAPIALISLVDAERQWFKSVLGLPMRETPRDISFCGHALQEEDLLVVPDATVDPRFAANPLVREAPMIRFYAGAPLKTETGDTLGTLCVMDHRPRQLSDAERQALRVLSTMVMSLIRLRRSDREQRELAERLARETQRLVDAQAVARIGSWETELADLRVRWSAETHRILETDPATFSPTHARFLERVHPEDRSRVDEAFRDSLDRPGAHTLEHRIITREGRVKIVEERWQVFFDGGRPVRAIGTCQDVTEQRQSSAQMRLLGTCVAHLNDVVVITEAEPLDEPGPRIIYVNDAFERVTGYRREEAIGRSPRFLQGPRTQRAVLDQIRAALRERSPVRRELINYTKTGDEYWVELEIVPVIDAADRLTHFIAIERDVTERRRAERLAERAARARLMHSRCSEMLIRANDEAEFLRSVCAIAIEAGGFQMAWVGYALDDEAKTIAPQAFAGAEKGYLGKIKLSWSAAAPSGDGPAARAIRSGEAVVVSDVTDPEARCWYGAEAVEHGFRAVVCLPLQETGQTFGVFVLYPADGAALAEEELRVLRDLADDLALGIRTLRAREERRRTHEAVLTMARGISAAVGREFFRDLTLSLAQALEADGALIATLDPASPELAATCCAVLDGKVVPNFVYDVAGLPWDQGGHGDWWVVARNAARQAPQPHWPAETAFESCVGKKLVDAEGRAIGLLFVQFRRPLPRPVFVISMLQIFAARAASEIERQASDAKTRDQAALLDKARDAIIVRDLEHRVTYWNRSAERLYGWTAAEVMGRSVVELLYLEPAQFERAQEQLRRTGEWTGELTQRTKTGRALTVEGRWTLVQRNDGGPRAVLAINTDISERKAMEQQLLRTQRMESIGTLAGGIAHDLNNLLLPITMGADILERDAALAGHYATIVASMKRSAERGASLVRQVLSFARGVDGDKVALDVRHIVREVETIIENSFPKNIAAEVEMPNDLPLIVADATQLNQVLLNLCVNARDAMPNGGRLTLRVGVMTVDENYAVMNRSARPGRYLVIQVADTGGGMTREVMDRIFEPFFTTKAFGHGSGLGLAVVTGIVRSHGGFVTVSSEVGRGSTFKVHLPVQTGLTEGAPTRPADLAAPAGNGEVILVVEDEKVIREVTQQALETAGYRVLTAEDGADAIRVYAAHRNEVALVLTDMMMPVMDGGALIRALHRLDPAVRIVAVSGLDEAGKATTTTAAPLGVRQFLAKPYSRDILLRTIGVALDGEPGLATASP